MIKNLMIVLAGLALAVGCKAMVNIAPTDRDEVAAEAPALADAVRNLDGVARNQRDVPSSLVDAISEFHTAADDFVAETERGTSQDRIDQRYVELIRAYVRVKLIFPQDKAEGVFKENYAAVTREWEKLSRATGYAGKKYEEKFGTK